MNSSFYPLLFKQNKKTLVWGTEDWTVSAVPGSESVVENGAWTDTKLTEIIANHPTGILGKAVAKRYNNQLPLLTKIIDAKQDLSIQVHPNDEMAMREHNKFGKSEMWYILDAKQDACLYAGFRQQITQEECKERITNGTITEVLAKHEVHKGDVFYLPAGRVHAICGGIRLVEVQQSSDVTYRIFDYNRLGLDGKPRELHTELAAKAIDYTIYPKYKTEHSDDTDVAHKILNTPYFSVKIIEATGSFHRNMIKYDSFIIIINLKGDCHVCIRGTQDHTILLPEGASCLVPAAIADYDLIPTGSTTKVLEAFINNKKSVGKFISDFLHFS